MAEPAPSPLHEALVRAGRTLGAALIASAIAVLPQVIGVFTFTPEATTALILGLTVLLNGLGKLIRGDGLTEKVPF